MTDNQTETLYTLEWKSKQAGMDGKSGNYNSRDLDQKVFTLKSEYPDIEYWIKSVE